MSVVTRLLTIMVFFFCLFGSMGSSHGAESERSSVGMVEGAIILYPAQTLKGEPYQSEYICRETFEKLLSLEYSSGSIVSWDWESDDPALGRDDDFHSIAICGEQGNFDGGTLKGYAPRAVSFSDDETSALIVEIDGKLELRRLPAELTLWESFGKDEALINNNDIRRLERAVATVLYMPHDDLGTPEFPRRELSVDSIREFLTLAGLDDDEDAAELSKRIAACAADPLSYWRNGDPEYEIEPPSSHTYKNFVWSVLLDNDFLRQVDWKAPSEDVAAHIRDLVPEDVAERIPPYRSLDDYSFDEIVDPDEVVTVLKECGSVLQKDALQILMWDTGGDGYAFFVIHRDHNDRILQLADELDLPVVGLSAKQGEP